MGCLEMVFSRVLVGIDGSEVSERALNVAIEICKRFNAALYVMYVIEPILVPSVDKAKIRTILDALKEHADRIVSKALIKAQKENVEAKPIITEGKPGPEICKKASELKADLIVVGSRGLGTISRFIVGSTSSYLFNHCTNKSILIVR